MIPLMDFIMEIMFLKYLFSFTLIFFSSRNFRISSQYVLTNNGALGLFTAVMTNPPVLLTISGIMSDVNSEYVDKRMVASPGLIFCVPDLASSTCAVVASMLTMSAPSTDVKILLRFWPNVPITRDASRPSSISCHWCLMSASPVLATSVFIAVVYVSVKASFALPSGMSAWALLGRFCSISSSRWLGLYWNSSVWGSSSW